MKKIKFPKLFIKFNGSKVGISYFHRPGKKGTIIFVHGLGCSKEDFLDATKVRELKDYEILAFDWPGAGGSPYPKDKNLGVNDLVKIINDFTIKFSRKNKKLILVGHSMGGVVVLLYAVKYPKKVVGFVNVEGSLISQNAWWSRKIRKAGFDIFKEKLFPAMIKDLKKSKNLGFRRYGGQLKNVSIKSYFDFSVSHVKICQGKNLLKNFLKLKLPKIFIYGTENKIWLPVVNKLKKSRCEIGPITRANHFPFFDSPNKFYKTISFFLSGCVISSGC